MNCYLPLLVGISHLQPRDQLAARFASIILMLRTDCRHIVSLFIHPQAPKYSARSPRVSQVTSSGLVTKLNMAAVCRELDRSYPCVIWISADCVLKMKTKNTSWHRHLPYSTLYLQKRNFFRDTHGQQVNKSDDTELREYGRYRSSSFKRADGGNPLPFKSLDSGYSCFVHTGGWIIKPIWVHYNLTIFADCF